MVELQWGICPYSKVYNNDDSHCFTILKEFCFNRRNIILWIVFYIFGYD